MKFSKCLATTIAAVVLLGIGVQGTESKVDKSLYDRGLEVVDLIVEMSRAEEYVSVFTGDPAIMEIITEYGEGNYEEPKAVYELSMSEEQMLSMAEIETMESISEGLKEILKKRVMGTLITQLNATSGVERLAASSICTVGKTFVCEDVVQDVIYLYTYENGAPIAVNFGIGEGGAVSASGTFLMTEDFPGDSAEEIEVFFAEIDIEVKEITEE